MRIGMHVSAAGGIINAVKNAHNKGCEIFQFFDRSPRGGKPTYSDEDIIEFKKLAKEYNLTEYYIHAPYYINLASSSNRIRHGSIAILREELEAGTKLGAKYMMFHMGSAKDYTEKKAVELVIKGINEILKNYKGSCQLLIENSAGAGQILGATFEEIATILKGVKNKNVGVCYDTCHGFASGYDIRDEKSLKSTFSNFDKLIGLDKLKLFHLNDSKTEFDSHRDRHANIGEGEIGKKAFELFVNYSKINKINAVLETPDVGEEKPWSLEVLLNSKNM
ncbi:deoxyribonuclease IV [Candidatus Falkowbacteria bacterium]|jgi:deoxyribonuclease IV|nr:deoxyribonuclease IV [Candidatus Falkowbacteria bacterium]